MKDVVGSIRVECDAPTFLNFSAIDNREGTASTVESTHFGLGNVNGNGKLGYYKMRLLGASVDDAGASVYSAIKGSTSLSSASVVFVDKGKVTGWANSENAQASGKIFQAVLAVGPVLGSSKEMAGPITDTTKLDGSATLNFNYAL
ncbi:Beta-fimbriae putative major subunit [Serratia fonticola AU-P3(3)]|nr:Beta-fimbriae putative major subunit [Serratia fonticola AU-P3(3)]